MVQSGIGAADKLNWVDFCQLCFVENTNNPPDITGIDVVISRIGKTKGLYHGFTLVMMCRVIYHES